LPPEAGLIYDLLSLLPAGIHKDDINRLQSYQTKTNDIPNSQQMSAKREYDAGVRGGEQDRGFAYLLVFL